MTDYTITPATLHEVCVVYRERVVGRLVRVEDDGDIVVARATDGNLVRWAGSLVQPETRLRPVFALWCGGGHLCGSFDTPAAAVEAREWFAEFGHALPDEHGLN